MAVLGFLTAGDLFLLFLGSNLYIDISCENSSNFISCFILEFMELEKPVFKPHKSDIAFGCDKAFIKPDIWALIHKRAIVVEAMLANASLLSLRKAIKEKADLSLFLDADSISLLNELVGNRYDTVYIKVDMHGDTAKFPYFVAYSKDIRFAASGLISQSGDFLVHLKAYFSPGIISRLPGELRELLTEASHGWASYTINIESAIGKSSLKLESDRLRLEFNKVEVR